MKIILILLFLSTQAIQIQNEIQQAWKIVENNIIEQYDIPQENQELQTEFIGNIMWGLFDLVTFGAFEKKPKKKTEKTNNGNSTQAQPQVVV